MRLLVYYASPQDVKGDISVIPYRPQLTRVVGSVTGSIFLQQVWYWWFNHDQQPFYKFNQPCDHPLYRDGDSWVEELCFSKHELRTARNKVSVKKTQSLSMDDVLCISLNELKPVIYWTDAGRVTHYTIDKNTLSELLEVAYGKIRIADLGNAALRILENSQNGFTNTKNTQKKYDDDDGAFKLLNSFGIDNPIAGELAEIVSIEEVRGWIDAAEKKRDTLRNPQGYVISKLRSGERPPQSIDKYTGGKYAEFIET